MIRFHNDYSEGCHPRILEKLWDINMQQNEGYGMDDYLNTPGADEHADRTCCA